MKLCSWNVNGIRAALKKGLAGFLAERGYDIVCLQETRAAKTDVTLNLPDAHVFWNEAEKKGYAGTVTISRRRPLSATYGMGNSEHDREGRLLTLEFDDFFVVNVYTPNAQRGLTRLAYRTERWDRDFLQYLKRLEMRKPVVFCGDLNVAHEEIDIANPKSNRRNAGFTDVERANFTRLLEAGFIDTFRAFTKEGGHYTWWAQFANARARNIGWRIDYVCISESLRPRLRSAIILPDVTGSDHCPVEITLT